MEGRRVVITLGHPSSQAHNRYGAHLFGRSPLLLNEYLQKHHRASSFWPAEGEKAGIPPSSASEAMLLARSEHLLRHSFLDSMASSSLLSNFSFESLEDDEEESATFKLM
ncbi:hypothetical protein Taro_011232 [Colocasia esculenta]|uniref:Uncharacterized protein n=1 Tax=Colocasia esculenta TaxID=4460 RepID=A0A843U111_COLES|nr:hypothetical protein [Colocasia esculenta]